MRYENFFLLLLLLFPTTLTLLVTLILKTEVQPFEETLRPMLTRRHTKFGCRRLSGSEYVVHTKLGQTHKVIR